MQNQEIPALLNRDILGGQVGMDAERRFKPVPAGNLEPPPYHALYLETLPTAWATAYTFQRAIESQDPQAVQEWAALFALDYFGVIHIKTYPQSELKSLYDPDLWPALSGTYPGQDGITSIKLLLTDRQVVVGGYYPGIFFFPSRGREAWPTDERLEMYLDGDRVSWEKCREGLLRGDREKQQFYLRLLGIARKLEGPVKTALVSFCASEPVFKDLQKSPIETALEDDPEPWSRPFVIKWHPGTTEDDQQRYRNEQERLLAAYPLKQELDGKMVYYLLSGLKRPSEWMKKEISPGLPAPNQYERVSETQIRVQSGEREILLDLGDQGKVELLKELFPTTEPYWCALHKQAIDVHASQTRRLHRKEIINNFGPFTPLKQEEMAICLAPATSKLLKHFPDMLENPDECVAATRNQETGGFDWEFTILGKKVVWPTEPKYSKALPASALEIWPPKFSPQWHLYVAHGRGANKEACGRWTLIDEQGRPGVDEHGQLLELANDEYVSILNATGSPNRPRALLLCDSGNNERGVLFLARIDGPSLDGSDASLSIDFGTSNTCLAFQLGGDEAKPLLFESDPDKGPGKSAISPLVVWGEAPKLESPGFVPFNWGARKGYFPTILISRQDQNLDAVKLKDIKTEHLFKVDIPGLHHGIEERVFDGTLARSWDVHKDLKWEDDPERPWRRPLFLGLALLYAHAEMFFRYGASIEQYTFTFPLAFSESQRKGFKEETQDVVNRIRRICFGGQAADCRYVNESEAIARSVDTEPSEDLIEVFIDIGGGTTDIAIRYFDKYVVLDSIKIAGKAFFRFSESNFSNSSQVEGSAKFRQHLGRLLLDLRTDDQFTDTIAAVKKNKLDIGTFYSLVINRLDDSEFSRKESAVLEATMGWPSYQMYRTRMFFKHILAYALLQSCAFAVERKLTKDVLSNGIRLILSGNGWGLMMFGEFRRSRTELKAECQEILDLLKGRLIETITDEEREYLGHLEVFDLNLLNDRNLSKAKTDVAVGALKNSLQEELLDDGDGRRRYAGVTLRNLSINGSPPMHFRWCERWGIEYIGQKIGRRGKIQIESLNIGRQVDGAEKKPTDHSLSVFTRLGDSLQSDRDPMPPEEWQKMNTALCQGKKYLDEKSNRLEHSPISLFVSRILYPEDAEHRFLNTLASINKTLK